MVYLHYTIHAVPFPTAPSTFDPKMRSEVGAVAVVSQFLCNTTPPPVRCTYTSPDLYVFLLLCIRGCARVARE